MIKYFVIVAFLVSVVGSAYWYINTTNRRIEALVSENATMAVNQTTMKNAINKNNETIKDMEQDAIENRERYERLEAEFSLFRMYGEELPAKFERHDLNSLALAKPELVEKIINSASKDANRCMEILSGARILEGENNSECPWLFE